MAKRGVLGPRELIVMLGVSFAGMACASRSSSSQTPHSANASTVKTQPAASASVTITSVSERDAATHVVYVISNRDSRPIWLVSDEWFVWKRDARGVEISFARERMVPGVEPFGYFRPRLEKLEPGASIERTLELAWPLKLSTLWNREPRASEPPKPYALEIRVGYGFDDKGKLHDDSLGVEERVLNWQHTAVSDRVVVR